MAVVDSNFMWIRIHSPSLQYTIQELELTRGFILTIVLYVVGAENSLEA